MKSICVFCGSSLGVKKEYQSAVEKLGHEFVKRNIKLVYGGAKVGLMGVLADTILKQGGNVFGVMPKSLVEKEVAHSSLSELVVVDSMHERKAMMHDLSDAFIAMPGGYGTFDEIFEALTWGQLDIHNKPCAFYNICGYYDKLLEFLTNTVEEGFISKPYVDMILTEQNPDLLLDMLNSYTHPQEDKAAWAKKQVR